jgi:hypothetical protein
MFCFSNWGNEQIEVLIWRWMIWWSGEDTHKCQKAKVNAPEIRKWMREKKQGIHLHALWALIRISVDGNIFLYLVEMRVCFHQMNWRIKKIRNKNGF